MRIDDAPQNESECRKNWNHSNFYSQTKQKKILQIHVAEKNSK